MRCPLRLPLAVLSKFKIWKPIPVVFAQERHTTSVVPHSVQPRAQPTSAANSSTSPSPTSPPPPAPTPLACRCGNTRYSYIPHRYHCLCSFPRGTFASGRWNAKFRPMVGELHDEVSDNQKAVCRQCDSINQHNSAMAPPALFKNFGKASSDLFKDDNWSATHKLEISNKNSQQTLNASVDAAGKSE